MKGREGRKVTTTCTYHYTVGTYARTREQGDPVQTVCLLGESFALPGTVPMRPVDEFILSPFFSPSPFAGED